MTPTLFLSMSLILILGITAQWLAWRLHLPSILLLLAFGILSGPVFGLLDPDRLFGDSLSPFLSLSVAIILFEGGLTLKLKDLSGSAGQVVRNLVSIGVLVTLVGACLAGMWLLNLNWEMALLLGALLVVTGPTVIGPLLRHIRPSGISGTILKWESIVIDPIGATLAVLVFEIILAREINTAAHVAVLGILKTIVAGFVIGFGAAMLVIQMFRRYWVPDFLQNSVALMLVVAVNLIANSIQDEAGLLGVTVMGIVLANQRQVSIQHILEFKENLQVLLISGLFIVLAAKLNLDAMTGVGWEFVLYFAILVFILRPLSVILSTLKSGVTTKEKIFLSWMAPRGIVAAAISSIFALELARHGHANTDDIVTYVFLVIIGTVTLYGLSSSWLAHNLGLAAPNPQGLLIMGAHAFSRELARRFQELEFPVLIVDNNAANVALCHRQGLRVYQGNLLAENTKPYLDLSGLGKLLALTGNDEANSLAAVHFCEVFTRSNVFQLTPRRSENGEGDMQPQYLRGRYLFNSELTISEIYSVFNRTEKIFMEKIGEDFDSEAFAKEVETGDLVPLFVVTEARQIQPWSEASKPVPKPGQILLCLRMEDPGEVDWEELEEEVT